MNIHPTAIVDEGAVIGEGTRVWHFTHVQSGARIGRNCVLGQNVYVGAGAVIGDDCKLQNNVSVFSGVTLGNGVFCGPSCVFSPTIYAPRTFPKAAARFLPTRVLDGARHGANATIVCGHIVGKNAMIGAGAVVVGVVPDHALMLGVPATQRGFVCTCGERLDGLKCAACGRLYMPVGEGLAEAHPSPKEPK
jgi:UDP-2-acetamido-3-amino-2,3-dideoxy-glucuronate N-acetyltransferase